MTSEDLVVIGSALLLMIFSAGIMIASGIALYQMIAG